jgi:uncharacterized protein (DUF2147 family)
MAGLQLHKGPEMTKANLKHSLLLLSLMLTGTTAWADPAGSLTGVWQQDDQSTTLRIAPCGNRGELCATVIAERLATGDPSSLNKVVAREIRPVGKRSWKGKMLTDGQAFAATAKLVGNDRMNLKICAMPFLCDSLRLNRMNGG